MWCSWHVAVHFAVLSLLASNWFGTAEYELALQARLTPCGLVQYMGYPCEVSYATTEDGYILEVERVPHGRNGTAGENGTDRHPVLFLPALASATDIWFLNFPSQSPGFQAADAGFDVWALNTREAERYSNHTTLSKDDPRYTKWSFDEMGRYDLAAGIDHVLDATGVPNLTIFALSQGTTATLILLSTRPEYNRKVDLVVAYAPVANISHIGPPTSLLVPIVPLFTTLAYPLTRAGYLGANKPTSETLTALCDLLSGQTCFLIITIPAFSSPYQLNETRLPVYAGHFPLGTSLQNLRHYYQERMPYHNSFAVTMWKNIRLTIGKYVLRSLVSPGSEQFRSVPSQEFIMYNYGATENLRRYNQTTPPAYPVERITSPLALFSSNGDTLADPVDVALLGSRLGPRVVLNRVVPQETFRHLDFAVGYRANDFLHNVAIDLIRQYSGQSR